MADKGRIMIYMYHPKFKRMGVRMDYEVVSSEKGILLSNPLVYIPSLGLEGIDAREHPEWKILVYQSHFRKSIEEELFKAIGLSFFFLEINFRELLI